MEKVVKVYFDPLLGNRDQIRALLKTLPVGSAHPFDGELLVHSQLDIITAIDISMHPEDYFSHALSLDDLGDDVLNRMKLFPSQIGIFNTEYTIQQAPASTFKVPIVSRGIHIFAISVREPTYYDLCVGEANYKTCCFNKRATFPGLTHSGDINASQVLLQHISLDSSKLDQTPRTVFVSGYSYNALHKYKAHNPLVLVANHGTKELYIVPVPLDAATIGQATLCCPLVIKKDATGDTLICSILSSPGIDNDLMCSGSELKSPAFGTAIQRATFTIDQSVSTPRGTSRSRRKATTAETEGEDVPVIDTGKDLLIATNSSTLPPIRDVGSAQAAQVIRFGKGMDWKDGDATARIRDANCSVSVLPCILGGLLEGPMLLATGEAPVNVPFHTVSELHEYYKLAKSVVVIVDEKMTDNARNVATTWRLNGLFILRADTKDTPGEGFDAASALNNMNINAITALAGPQSLVLAQLGTKYYFYRGMIDPSQLKVNAPDLKFGSDVSALITTHGLGKTARLAHSRSWPRVIDLSVNNPRVFLPYSNQTMKIEQLKDTFRDASLHEVQKFKNDIAPLVPQLQALLPQHRLHEFCHVLIGLLKGKVDDELATTRRAYARFVTQEYDPSNPESIKKKNAMLSGVRRLTKEAYGNVQWLTEALDNVISTQTTSSRSHDLKRLARQANIQGNVAVTKNMTFTQLAEMLEEHAEQMGVLVVNVKTDQYHEYISKSLYLAQGDDSSEVFDTCFLDSRTIHLEGLDAGIVLEQSQLEHDGPLASQHGQQQPILAIPYLNKSLGSRGSMLAWVCWDEFVNLRNPYTVRWVEKCNDAHIAALRIMMRSTLSEAVSSREFVGLQPGSLSTGQLMGALLMTAMRQLAATRNTPTKSASNPDDTSILLMRGLFGNFLTIAGSGARPMSFVWQLFGKLPQLKIPATTFAWSWYENAARLLPYSAWPLQQFKLNLFFLLDKLILRMMARNMRVKERGTSGQVKRIISLQKYCRARNVQLIHSRTIITILQKMLTGDSEIDCQAAAKRLLKVVPEHVQNETQSYKRLHRYIQHLAKGGNQRSHDNLIAANVFTKRSATFAEAKTNLLQQLKQNDSGNITQAYQKLLETKTAIEKLWGLEPGSVHMQNANTIENIRVALVSPDHTPQQPHDEAAFSAFVAGLASDAEIVRKPWKVGVTNEEIEKLDEGLVHHVLYGKIEADPEQPVPQVAFPEGVALQNVSSKIDVARERVVETQVKPDEFTYFEKCMSPAFLYAVRTTNNMDDVCELLGITRGAMDAFLALLTPASFKAEEHISNNFKGMVLSLLRNPSRDFSVLKPTNMLLSELAIEDA